MAAYPWRPTVCAPVEAPCILTDGTVTLADGSREGLATDVRLNNGWGVSGPVLLLGEAERPPAVALRVGWYSFADDAFFFGALPFVPPLATLFEAGIQRDGSEEPCLPNRLIIGVAPGGAMAAWLSGDAVALRVQGAQATRADVDFSTVTSGTEVDRTAYRYTMLRDAVGEDMTARILAGAWDPTLWQRVLVRYPVRVAVTGIAHMFRMVLRFADGERDHYAGLEGLDRVEDRAMPTIFQLSYVDSSGVAQREHFHVTADAITSAAERVRDAEPTSPITVVLELGDGPDAAVVSVRGRQNGVTVQVSRAVT